MNYQLIPSAIANPLDREAAIAAVKHYSDGKFFAVLFRHGSWAFPSWDESKIEGSIDHLKKVGAKRIQFEVREMDDGNYVVAFNEKVFTVVLRNEYLSLRDQIILEAKTPGVDETILAKEGAPEDYVFIGLFGRTRLLQDIEKPEPVAELSPTN